MKTVRVSFGSSPWNLIVRELTPLILVIENCKRASIVVLENCKSTPLMVDIENCKSWRTLLTVVFESCKWPTLRAHLMVGFKNCKSFFNSSP